MANPARSHATRYPGIHVLAMFACGLLLPSTTPSARTAEVLSRRDSAVALPSSGNGDSVAPWIDRTGRFILFSSSAADLVTNDNGALTLDVFLYDRASNATV